MKQKKRFIKPTLTALLAFACLATSCATVTPENAKAETVTTPNTQESILRGIYTSIRLDIYGGGGKVWVTANNHLTILPSTVWVIVELYSSETYQSSYEDMTLVASNSIADLNMGESIVAESSTGGVQKYWCGCVRYKVDNKQWEEMTTGTFLFTADGTLAA